jgi:Protein of unknown function (DUF3667)
VSAHQFEELDGLAPTIRCLNCAAPVNGAFCAACGQHAVDLNASTWHVLREALGDATDLDGRVARTARALLSPGRLTLEFLRGRRVPYVGPLKLFRWWVVMLRSAIIVSVGAMAIFEVIVHGA